MNINTTKSEFLAELKEELKMREKNWRRIKIKGSVKFMNPEHQKRYNTLKDLKEIIEEANEKEIYEFKRRRVIKEEAIQKQLF